jgi:hypothetical protein
MTFIKPIAPLVAKEELDIELSLDRLINNLSRIDVVRTEQAHVLLDRFRQDLKASNSVDISRYIRSDLPRRKEDLDKFLTSVRETTRKSILRAIALYDWASKIDEYLDQISSSEKDIKEKVISLIKEISLANRNTAVTDARMVSLNFRKKDDIEKTDAFNSITSGSITNKITSAIVPAICSIKFGRQVFLKNIYSNYSEDLTDISELGNKRYDTTQENLEASLNITNSTPFSIVDFGLDIPFEVIQVYSIDPDNKKEDITDWVIGNNVQVNAVLAIEKTPDSSLDANSVHSYSFIFPKPITSIEIKIRISSFDTYPLKMFNLVNSRGEIIKQFSLLESMLIDRRLLGEKYIEQKKIIDEEAKTGIIKEISKPSSLRIITFVKCNVYSILAVSQSTTLLAPFQSDLKIRRVDIYVDSYDPLQLIKFSVVSGENEKQPISPVNSNPVSPTRIIYESILPKNIQIEVIIPKVEGYLPVLHGLTTIIGEVNL